MATTGQELAGDGANIDIANDDWSNPTNITVQSDAAAATVFDVSNILHAHAFDFSVLGDSDTIDGIIVRIRASENAGGTQTMRVRLADDAGSLVGDTKEQEIDGTSPATYTFGGSADAWGLSLTGADLKADLVGCGIRQLDATPMSVYWVTIEVFYTPAGTPVSQTMTAAAEHVAVASDAEVAPAEHLGGVSDTLVAEAEHRDWAFFDETFEGVGYSETWSAGETVTGSAVLDEDAASP